MTGVDPPLSDDLWEDDVPEAPTARPEAELVADAMAAFSLSKSEAEELVAAYTPRQVETLLLRHWRQSE
ncbi:hypothetical protein SAMN04487948_12516 [Halogranum amylolyticum]|uniref:Uncharacterized protein n=1 Tax=Halogranum amylolyticum TaxID=660520 RepID=A0A1H8W9I1_9EURY|nr:hypothetical protein [Halogranum amylolyticum]SEP23778.1 hypothetical protein SAMN04487948_12516 [Halogranum amylolyticum]